MRDGCRPTDPCGNEAARPVDVKGRSTGMQSSRPMMPGAAKNGSVDLRHQRLDVLQ